MFWLSVRFLIWLSVRFLSFCCVLLECNNCEIKMYQNAPSQRAAVDAHRPLHPACHSGLLAMQGPRTASHAHFPPQPVSLSADDAEPGAAKAPPASLMRCPLPSLTHSYLSCACYVCNDYCAVVCVVRCGIPTLGLQTFRQQIITGQSVNVAETDCISDLPTD